MAAAPLSSTLKQAQVVRQALAESLLDLRQALHDPVLAWRDIGRVHAREYVQAVRTGEPRDLAESQWFDWSPAFADSLARIWMGHLAASRLALTDGLVLHPVSGSHHARHDHGAAFCTFAFVVGASLALLDEGVVERVLLLDLDAHYGDGHDALTSDDPRFVHFDIAASGRRHVRREARGRVGRDPPQPPTTSTRSTTNCRPSWTACSPTSCSTSLGWTATRATTWAASRA